MRCSVIVPTYNRPKSLQKTIQALIHLDYPDYEIIVVDDGSSQQIRVPDGVTLVHQQNAGPASARNAGAAIATGQLLAFTDDDCEPAPNWLTELTKQHLETPNALLGGRVINGYPDNPYATATQLMVDFLRGSPPKFLPSNNWGIGRKRFQQLNGLRTDFPLAAGEDREFCNRAQPLVSCPNAIVYHYHNLTLRRYWQQHITYGRGARHLREVQKRSNFAKLGFYRDLLQYPIRQCGLRGAKYSALLVLAQLATTVGYVSSRGTIPDLRA